MKNHLKIFIIILFATLTIDNAKASWNSVYQFGIEINKSENGKMIYGKTNAFLWIPPKAKVIRAVILAPSNVIERRLCDSPILRAQAEKDGLAIIFFNAGWQKKTPLIEYIQMILDKLAEKSGYNELRTVPWITVGHSGNSKFCENMGRLKPERMLANIVFKGKVPGVAKDGSITGLIGIPILFIGGEFEEVMSSNKVRNFFWTEKLTFFAIDRKAVPQSLLSGMVDRGHGHFSLFSEMISYTTLFIHKTMDARLNKNRSLKNVHFESGWLSDPTGKYAPAPAKKYTGKPEEAFWHFDEEQVKAWIPLFIHDKGKKEQLVALTQNDTIAPWWKGWAIQQLDFNPLPDGISFRVGGNFRNEIPVIFADNGVKVGHSDNGPIYLMLKDGPALPSKQTRILFVYVSTARELTVVPHILLSAHFTMEILNIVKQQLSPISMYPGLTLKGQNKTSLFR